MVWRTGGELLDGWMDGWIGWMDGWWMDAFTMMVESGESGRVPSSRRERQILRSRQP